jgi:hypothetical protein
VSGPRQRVTATPFRRIIGGASGIAQSVLGVNLAPEEVIEARRAICAACPQLKRSHCGLCGCSITHKTRLASQRCPDNPPRWIAVTVGGSAP